MLKLFHDFSKILKNDLTYLDDINHYFLSLLGEVTVDITFFKGMYWLLQAFSSCGKWGYSLVASLAASYRVGFLVAEHGL